jgi:hypothetical protein
MSTKIVQSFDFVTGVVVASFLVAAIRFSPLFRTIALVLVAGLFVWAYLSGGGVPGVLDFARAAKANAMAAPLFMQGLLTGAVLMTVVLAASTHRRLM